MIHTNRIVTVGEQECIIDRPIVLYRGDREVEIEFTLVGNEFMFSEEGNVIKSVNASHGQLVLNTPSGEHMFSELAECHEGKVVFVVTKEMIDEFIEMGFYSFQIRLYDSAEMKSRVTIPPVMNGFDIRNPIAAEDETNVVDQGIVDYARIFKDQSNEELPTFDWQGNYNKTEWVHHDVITENKMNKIEDALYSINANVKESDIVMLNALDNVKKDADKYVKEHMAEVEADVDEFERNLNTDVQQFKIDTNAAMTTHKNEVSEVVDGFDAQLAHITYKKYNVKDYGAKGDGLTDDAGAIRKCIEDLPQSNFELIFPPGLYMQGDGTYNTEDYINTSDNANKGVPIYFEFRDKSNFKITGYGATIKAHPSNGCITNNRGFDFSNCENFVISGLSYDGSISERQPSMGDLSGYNSQNGFQFSHCKNGSINDVESSYCCMDGFGISSLIWGISSIEQAKISENLIFNNCKGLYNYRQGVSVVTAKNITFKKCNYSYTGSIYGASPMAGIDLEEGYYDTFNLRGQNNCIIDDCIFIQNGGSGVALHWGTHNSTVKNSLFKNNNIFTPADNGGKSVNNTIIGNTLYNCRVDVSGGGEHIINNKFIQDAFGGTGIGITYRQCSSYVTDNNLARVSKIEGNSFVNLLGLKECYDNNQSVGIVWTLGSNCIVTDNTWNNCLAPNNTLFPYNVPMLSQNNSFLLSENQVEGITSGSLGLLALTANNSFNNTCSHYSLYTAPGNSIFGIVDSEDYYSDKFRLVKRRAYHFFNNEYVKISIKKQSYTKIRFSGGGSGVDNAPFCELVYANNYQLIETNLLGAREQPKLIYDTNIISEDGYIVIKLKLNVGWGRIFVEVDSLGNTSNSADKDNIKIELLKSDNIDFSTFDYVKLS